LTLVHVDADGPPVQPDVTRRRLSPVLGEPQLRPEAPVELARAAAQRELELVVGPPAEVVLLEDDVAYRAVDVDHRDPLADPGPVHHLRRERPDLEVVRTHEVFRDPLAE